MPKKEGKKKRSKRGGGGGGEGAWFGEERNSDIKLEEGLKRGKEKHFLAH